MSVNAIWGGVFMANLSVPCMRLRVLRRPAVLGPISVADRRHPRAVRRLRRRRGRRHSPTPHPRFAYRYFSSCESIFGWLNYLVRANYPQNTTTPFSSPLIHLSTSPSHFVCISLYVFIRLSHAHSCDLNDRTHLVVLMLARSLIRGLPLSSVRRPQATPSR